VVVKQLSSNSDVVIMAPVEGSEYYAPSVTPDGGYVDVLVRRPSDPALVRIPFLGGTPCMPCPHPTARSSLATARKSVSCASTPTARAPP
jgi:hypothetical protein